MTAITYRMPFGVPGDLSRNFGNNTVEAQAYGATAFPAYGLVAKVSTNTVIPISANNDVVYGFLVRSFPITGPNASDALGVSVPPTAGVAGILRRGYMTVNVQLGSASCALGSSVYIRYQNPSGAQIVAGLEGASTGNTYQLTTAFFTGPADANNNAEIGYNI